MTWEQEMREQVKERAEALALELAEEIAQERAEKMAQERAEELVAQKDIETARKMLANGKLSEQEIAGITGLPVDRLVQLRQEASAVKA